MTTIRRDDLSKRLLEEVEAGLKSGNARLVVSRLESAMNRWMAEHQRKEFAKESGVTFVLADDLEELTVSVVTLGLNRSEKAPALRLMAICGISDRFDGVMLANASLNARNWLGALQLIYFFGVDEEFDVSEILESLIMQTKVVHPPKNVASFFDLPSLRFATRKRLIHMLMEKYASLDRYDLCLDVAFHFHDFPIDVQYFVDQLVVGKRFQAAFGYISKFGMGEVYCSPTWLNLLIRVGDFNTIDVLVSHSEDCQRRLVFVLAENDLVGLARVQCARYKLKPPPSLSFFEDFITFDHFGFPIDSRYMFVTSESDFERMSHALEGDLLQGGFKVLGVDTETRPSFKKGEKFKTSLLQLATKNHVFVVDLFSQWFGKMAQDVLEMVFTSPAVVKCGVAVRQDLLSLRKDYPHFRCFASFCCVLDLSELHAAASAHARKSLPWPEVSSEMSAVDRAILSYHTSSKVQACGLSNMCVYYCGRKLDKRQRMSNWAKRPLTMSQQHYAAMDAFIAVVLFDACRLELETYDGNLSTVLACAQWEG